MLIALDTKDERLKASEFGADQVWNPAKMDVVKEIKNYTGSYGCDIYIEATGYMSQSGYGDDSQTREIRGVRCLSQSTTLDWSIIGDQKELDLLGASQSVLFPGSDRLAP